MALAGPFDITFARNTDYNADMALKDSNGDAINLTSYTVEADIVGEGNIVPAGRFELSPTISDEVNGIINIALNDTETGTFSSTRGLPFERLPKWDLLVTTPGGFTTKELKGVVNVSDTETT